MDEQQAAHYLYRRIRGLGVQPASRRHYVDRAQVWVVGNHDWIRNAPQMLRTLSESEQRSDYRMIAVRLRADEQHCASHYAMLPTAAYRAGFRFRKQNDRARFKDNAEVLLSLLNESLIEEPTQPGRTFQQLGVPYAYCGVIISE